MRHFSKLVCFSTLFLIFAGAMVNSTDSGLAVPDWPLSYGMLFPPMVGGVFYEHGHRMIATVVGFFTLCLTIWVFLKSDQKWIKILAAVALGSVILQGILGGLTVIYLLPTPISVAHGVLAQTFFLMTIVLAYGLSKERSLRKPFELDEKQKTTARWVGYFMIATYIQLIIAAIMRHTQSGMAILDFPKMGGYWIPFLNTKDMLFNINDARFELGLDNVTLPQVIIHFVHRFMALILVVMLIIVNKNFTKAFHSNGKTKQTLLILNGLIVFQILFGIASVLTVRSPWITSIHVVGGATILGVSLLLLLRMSSLSWESFKEVLVK